jgi:putative DNA primase/helicase
MFHFLKQPATTKVPVIRTLHDLKPYKNWVCYDTKKVPISPVTGKAASCNEPTTWGTYEQARLFWARRRSRIQGLGFMLTREFNITVIDLDHCIVDGKLSAFAQEIVESLDSYTEISPSGTGLHIWLQGDIVENLPTDIKAD